MPMVVMGFRWFESLLSRGWTQTPKFVGIIIFIIKWPLEIKSPSNWIRFVILCLGVKSIENSLLALPQTKHRVGFCRNHIRRSQWFGQRLSQLWLGHNDFYLASTAQDQWVFRSTWTRVRHSLDIYWIWEAPQFVLGWEADLQTQPKILFCGMVY